MRSSHQERLDGRLAQNTGWAAPLPDFGSMPRANEAPRLRVETDTRTTINSRFWESVQVSGPTAVSAAALAAHPTHGASEQQPSQTRFDTRQWKSDAAPPYFPDSRGPGMRPQLPSSSVWANPHFDGWDPESTDTTRELRFVVKEENRNRGDDASLRSLQRQFEHRWGPPVSVERLAAADRLRPAVADWSVSRTPPSPAENGARQTS
jgi:hypothetical protein